MPGSTATPSPATPGATPGPATTGPATPSSATAPLYAIKAELFRCLAHPTRIQALEVLSAAPEHAAPVSELLAATGVEASVLSQHLAVLKRAGVVTSTRSGNAVVYRLGRPLVAELLVVARAFLRETLADSGARLAAADALPALTGADMPPGAAARPGPEVAAAGPAGAGATVGAGAPQGVGTRAGADEPPADDARDAR
ncbi:ArsR/SmtB family transcription factor [Cellulomonas fimi]|uniref:Transcriptional regulator, ArsR family n=1 Tax=Cellulomonas fimi (strain ATCC 484 / DSM 20113 / JCM 1341 / CCUG 24087 / LMG 16345 / NBRC 15513 / NCIMB 8980 / NCTC 7547 / NRS-133) TaxID=590998 RepID=F4H636_CELFA|nr:metalloregulator ArsR/SmtB family transcription factor [Cellulomonas fimi]AEE46766.1 transcriptional regulator, ArsR family [Cellulomonas fimi ATCC 484]VEH34122.1 Uncharacterized HTH-type transcriptional regulator Rv0081/MT0088 [Cellulomonas fimi]